MTSAQTIASERRNGPVETGLLPPVCVLAFAFSNFVIGSLHFDTPLVLCVCLAAISAQAGLHAIWCVFAPVSTARKLTVAILVGLLWIAAWALGIAVYFYHDAHLPHLGWSGEVRDPGQRWRDEVAPILLYLPLAILAIQSPLWVARHWFRWRLSRPAEDAEQYCATQLKLRDIFIAMGAVAMALSAARVSMSYSTSATSPEQSLVLLIPALAIAVVSWLTMLPTLAATLGNHLRWLLGAVATEVGGGLLSLAGASTEILRVFGYVAVASVVFSMGLAGPLLYARSLGYRLHTDRR